MEGARRSAAARLALGTVQFGLPYGLAHGGSAVPSDTARAVLDEFRRAGADTIDTAVAYGASEEVLGSIGVGGWAVVTKLPSPPDATRETSGWVRATVTRSLKLMGISHLDGLLTHRSQDLLGPSADDLWQVLEDLREAGVVNKIGVSVYSPQQLSAVLDRFRPDLVQLPYNVLDRRMAVSGWLDRLNGDGIEVHARSAFLQGLLLMEPDRRPPYFERWREVLGAWDKWVREAGVDPSAAALRFVLDDARISRTVVGVDSLPQAEQLIAAASLPGVPPAPGPLASDDLELIEPTRWKVS